MPTLDFVDAFINATADDLAAIREKIANHEKQLDGLRAVEQALDLRLNGKQQARRPAAPAEGVWKGCCPPIIAGTAGAVARGIAAVVEEKRRRVALYLMANGPKLKEAVGKACTIAVQGPGCLSRVLECDWFHVNPDGMVSITDKGERANPEGR